MVSFSFLVAPSVSLVRRRPVKRGVVGDDRPGESGEKAEPLFGKSGKVLWMLTLENSPVLLY